MGTIQITTDKSMRSTLAYGTEAFPFAYYQDELSAYDSRCVEWHWHREFEFSLVAGGSVTCKIGQKAISLDAGDGLFLNSKTIHRFEAAEGGTLKNLIFPAEFIASPGSIVAQKYVQPVLSARCEYVVLKQGQISDDESLRLMGEMCGTVESGGPVWELRTQRLALELWGELYALFRNRLGEERLREGHFSQARLREMLSYIHRNYGGTITLKDISAAANISPSEALRCFRAGVGTTPVRYLNQYRLRRAKDLLLSTGDTVTAVAAAVGFESAGYFCRVFKASYGLAPNEFRKARGQRGNGELRLLRR